MTNKYARQPEEVIDLHGQTRAEAKETLDRLISEGRFNHVRIITGKGSFRDSGPVLREFVKDYLSSRGMEFDVAKLYDGGEGALEVYIKGKL